MSEERLPDAELEILACLGRLQEATARELREALADIRPLAHASVVTLLNRLEKKGLVVKRKAAGSKAFVFRPKRQPARTYRKVAADFVERVFGGDGVQLVASVFETKPPDRAQLRELRRILDELEQNADQDEEERS